MNAMISARLHSLAHRALRVPDVREDRVHLLVQTLELAQAELVDLVRRHRCGGRRLEHPAVILLTVRSRRDARVARRDRPLGLQLGDLPIERGCDFLLCDHARATRPVPRHVRRASLDGPDQRSSFTRVLRRETHLAQRLVQKEHRRNESCRTRRLDAAELTVELLRVRLQTREVRLGVGCALDQVIAIEEARYVEVGSDVLDDHVRGVAPAADGDVTVG
jgi:hypothetical protein